ncbi:MAG TPA: Gfo/Idh/MocA family oxidoreductase [Gemmataceae bacterium]|jgi:predicted dehydrogenase|nr:Gfo/Idh/MocA family oxidoreductase [Gemmataceae bacterium]
MRFALLGDHPDGLEMARSLVATGRYELAAVLDAPIPEFAPSARPFTDFEEILADPAVELVIVAGKLTVRGEQLRRALQSERHVLCVHPCADRLDRAYEAALIAEETKKMLLPLLPDSLQPAIVQFAQTLQSKAVGSRRFEWLTWEQRVCGSLGEERAFGGWDLLRRLGGEIVEVSGFAEQEDLLRDKPLLATGRFEKGGLFQIILLPLRKEETTWLTLEVESATVELEKPTDGLWRVAPSDGSSPLPSMPAGNRWHGLLSVFEMALSNPAEPLPLTWDDAIRTMELDDALRQSVEKRRAIPMEYAEVSEQASARGSITLIGCGMIWLMLLAFAVSIWLPWIRWLVVPMLVGFLGLLAVRWIVERNK